MFQTREKMNMIKGLLSVIFFGFVNVWLNVER